MSDELSTPAPTPVAPRHEDMKTLTLILYALYGASLFTGFTAIVAIVVNYIKREDMAGTLFESHFTWQMRTFWWGLAWAVLGFVLAFVGIGFVILFVNWVWFVYRVVKGVLYLLDGKPMDVK